MVARVLGISMTDIIRACKKYEFDVRDTNNESQVTREEQQAMIRDGVELIVLFKVFNAVKLSTKTICWRGSCVLKRLRSLT